MLMRKRNLLILFSLAILLAGCAGGSLPGPTPDPPPTDPDEIFDGSMTHLSLEFERSTADAQALAQNQDPDEPEVAYIRITRTDGEQIVYSVLRELELEFGAASFALDNQLPAEKGYQASTIILKGKEFLEVNSLTGINAPAKTVTTLPVLMEPPQYTLNLPAEMYSGGNINQIQARVPDHLSKFTYVYIWLGLDPWERNGLGDPDGWLLPGRSGFLPEVAEPTKLFYQVGVAPVASLVPDQRVWPYHYEPNLEDEEELPYIWVYPYPGWEE